MLDFWLRIEAAAGRILNRVLRRNPMLHRWPEEIFRLGRQGSSRRGREWLPELVAQVQAQISIRRSLSARAEIYYITESVLPLRQVTNPESEFMFNRTGTNGQFSN